MKLLIASDIHGNLENTKRLLEKFTTSKADYLIILGDFGGVWYYPESRFYKQNVYLQKWLSKYAPESVITGI